MKTHHSNLRTGFTIIEIIVVISITVILSVVSFSTFSGLNKRQSLDKETAKITSLLEEARTLSLANFNGSGYGVHIDSGSVTRFVGTMYNANSSSNIVMPLSSNVYISTTSPYGLAASSTNIVFSQLSGTTSSFGTLGIKLVSGTTTSIIRIYSSGLVEVSK